MNLFILIFLLVISILFGGIIVVHAASYSEIKYPTIHPDPLDLERLVWAIKQVENWDGHTPGRLGEWGPMQMRPAIYKRYANDELGYVQKLEWLHGHERAAKILLGKDADTEADLRAWRRLGG